MNLDSSISIYKYTVLILGRTVKFNEGEFGEIPVFSAQYFRNLKILKN